ncbi:MAG: DNA repair protein RecN [Prevotellaceae bacterium]|jgi:DNA repair protein RecN (Recombination protein N)|nr:DNA repair protein RecN [Prevotellaceae bacterium]
MLKSLYISNYALIEELHIEFDTGFSVITGETGAGKSIIVGALSLIMGQRADIKVIKQGKDKCVVETEFDISTYNLKQFFEENELDFSANQCIIRREVSSAGKSRAFVNDTPASLQVLRSLAGSLLDIHSQHENLELGNDVYQRDLVDNFAQNQDVIEKYKVAFDDWKSKTSELQKLKNIASNQISELEYLKFQFQQLSESQLVEGEQEDLEQELETLNHAEEIKKELSFADNLLTNSDSTIISQLKSTLYAINKVKNYISDGEYLHRRIDSVYVELKDIALEINKLEERIEYDPARLERVENRLSDLYALEKKFNARTVAELIAKREDIEQQLLAIENFDEAILSLQRDVALKLEILAQNGKALTKSRVNVSKSIENTLITELRELGIEHAQVKVEITDLQEFTENGADNISILFSANKNIVPQPVAQVASGGEVSRLMLAIKSLLASKIELPTIIFDEIDTGVSGDIADRVGGIMKRMSGDMQVIAITHLPQIAARGEQHFRVFKTDEKQEVTTKIEKLAPQSRIAEIAQMLSGSTVTESAVANAKELLKIK